MTESVACREKLKLARQEHVQFAEGWFDNLERFVRQDAAVVTLDREHHQDVAQFTKVVEALPDDRLSSAQPDRDRVLVHGRTLSEIRGEVKP